MNLRLVEFSVGEQDLPASSPSGSPMTADSAGLIVYGGFRYPKSSLIPCLWLDDGHALQRTVTPPLGSADSVIVLDTLTFPFEFVDPDDWSAHWTVHMPDLPAEDLLTLFESVLLPHLAPDHIVYFSSEQSLLRSRSALNLSKQQCRVGDPATHVASLVEPPEQMSRDERLFELDILKGICASLVQVHGRFGEPGIIKVSVAGTQDRDSLSYAQRRLPFTVDDASGSQEASVALIDRQLGAEGQRSQTLSCAWSDIGPGGKLLVVEDLTSTQFDIASLGLEILQVSGGHSVREDVMTVWNGNRREEVIGLVTIGKLGSDHGI